jgi:hypothetical protein
MSKTLWFIIIVLMPFSFACRKSTSPDVSAREFAFDFESDSDGWVVGYADYPANLSQSDSLVLYGMSYGHGLLPASVQPRQSGIRVRGVNRSDDLFMYLKRRVTGLSPNADYLLTMDVDIASNVASNLIGVGGAPGEGVKVKAGASVNEPFNIRDGMGWYRLNIDKGNQSVGGADMSVIGDMAVKDTTTVYTVVRRSLGTPMKRRTDANGGLWLSVGTDSGFEGLTEVYYAAIRARLQPQ